ncbi:hypothetical protein [Sphingomicrobium astaxanthinifaciens]|uniref:hypothetical protein n=1 Tax=Sphingomicrobium astaxanthinifaciens TaxID=1227949 RepID=UPI002ACEF7D1|nr:hypothetical protein [Sphingomicrobium astaxanthinifaciens]
MLSKIARLFTIKTRFEAALITYAIALGAVMRGQAYAHQFPGLLGNLLFLACLGVVFLAGAKLFDAVRPAPPAISRGPWRTPARHRGHRRRHHRRRRASDRTPRLAPPIRARRP